jgi:hypothetical protein
MRRDEYLENIQKRKIGMEELIDVLRERYSDCVFSLHRKNSFWVLRCYKNQKPWWSLLGKKSEIAREIEYLLS